jgi:hypothetical protein
MLKPLAKLENWAVVDSVASQSYQELRPGKHLTGYVSGHANLPNAKFIYTSLITGVDYNKALVETNNTMYQLAEPSEDYRRWFEERKGSAVA